MSDDAQRYDPTSSDIYSQTPSVSESEDLEPTQAYEGQDRYRHNLLMLSVYPGVDSAQAVQSARQYVDWFLNTPTLPCPLTAGTPVQLTDGKIYLFYPEFQDECTNYVLFMKDSVDRYHPFCIPDPQGPWCALTSYPKECMGGGRPETQHLRVRHCQSNNDFRRNPHHLIDPLRGTFYHPLVTNGVLTTCVVGEERLPESIMGGSGVEEPVQEDMIQYRNGTITVYWDTTFHPELFEPGNGDLYFYTRLLVVRTLEDFWRNLNEAFSRNSLAPPQIDESRV